MQSLRDFNDIMVLHRSLSGCDDVPRALKLAAYDEALAEFTGKYQHPDFILVAKSLRVSLAPPAVIAKEKPVGPPPTRSANAISAARTTPPQGKSLKASPR